ncbi:insulinase family protein [Dactylosporangium sp. NBC_01737]|uniref:M16 family metallopeptidase n=1 Tax=Dactylosporangium sp. NBC_01737 TaxID=2975959 RepID=UPI002E10629B|nr:insulinase family protein [Dactylosporangium sp. NBC_01737]
MLHRTDVDGVATLLAPGSGPMTAGLTFRVGLADEGAARIGITHLVEHLALHRHGVADYHYNGATGSVVTHFHMQGSESDIVTYLEMLCDSLANLPVQRLETEKAILRTEAAGRGGGVNRMLPMWRYGAQHYGLVSYPEWGIDRLGPDDVQAWASAWFTRANAVLWVSGDRIPPGLRLRLPAGTLRPVPVASTILPATPAYFTGAAGGVVFDGITRRHPAGSVFALMLERELFRSLRQESGLSYAASAAYDPRGDGFAVVTAFADALPEKQGAVVGGFVDVLAGFRVGRILQTELDAVRAKRDEALRHRDAAADRLPGLATDLLTGARLRSLDELRASLHAVTLADVHAAALQVLGSGLLQVPSGSRADWAGFVAAPTTSTDAIPGHTYRAVDGSGAALVLGADGVSVVDGECRATVRYRSCAVVHAWPDGARQLIGLDGIAVLVEPALFAAPADTTARIDRSVDPSIVLPMPARNPGDTPRPAPAPSSGGFPSSTGPIPGTAGVLPPGGSFPPVTGTFPPFTGLRPPSGGMFPPSN